LGPQPGSPAAYTLAQTRIEALRAERAAARRNALDEAIAPLLELAAALRTGAQRDALAAYVIRKLHSTWNPRKPPGSWQ
jgi:type VI protein secretion system component VasF